MPKVYAFQDMTKPASITGTAVAGGTLAENTTYYYRVIGTREASGATASYWVGKTKSSDEFSVTTTATNKSVQISFTQPSGEGLLSYRIFRSTIPGGMLNNSTSCIAFYPKDVTYRSGTTITFTDTGYANVGGNTFLNIDTDPHGVLTLTGSATGDRYSIVDLYNADVAGGWGVIKKLDAHTYLVNCYVKMQSQFWNDTFKNIIWADGYDASSADMKFGSISGSNRTSGTCNIIITSQWLSGAGCNVLNAYRTNFLYVYPFENGTSLGLTSLTWSSGVIQDCTCEKFRGFTPFSATNCILKNFTYSGYDNAFGTGQASFINVRMLQGSRAWQTSGTSSIYGKGVFIDGGNAILWIGLNNTVNLVDSQFVNVGSVNSNATGSVLNDKISFNLNVVDNNQVAVSGANVKIYDNSATLVVNVDTAASGSIAEQEITRRQYTVTNLTVNGPFNKYPFTIVVSKTGYETYTEKVSYLLSLAVVKTVALKQALKLRQTIEGDLLLALKPELGSISKLLKL